MGYVYTGAACTDYASPEECGLKPTTTTQANTGGGWTAAVPVLGTFLGNLFGTNQQRQYAAPPRTGISPMIWIAGGVGLVAILLLTRKKSA